MTNEAPKDAIASAKMLWRNFDGHGYGKEAFAAHVRAAKWDQDLRVPFITLHNTGAPTLAQWIQSSPTPEQRIKNLQAYYQNTEHWHAGPHLFIGPEGIWGFTDLEVPGVAQSCWNNFPDPANPGRRAYSIAIEMVGDYSTEAFDSGAGEKVRDNAVWALAVLHVALGLRPDGYKRGVQGLHFHKDCAADHHDCPGKNVDRDDMVKRVLAAMETVKGVSAITPPAPAPAPVPEMTEPSATDEVAILTQAESSFDASKVAAKPQAWNGRVLGKLPAKHLAHVRPLAMFTSTLPSPPDACSWYAKAQRTAFGMMLNDELGCCTCAAIGHAIQCWTANADVEVTLPDPTILGLYERLCGYVQGNPQTDNGGVEVDVLNGWLKSPILGPDGKEHELAGFFSVSPLNDTEMKQAIQLFGCAYLGLNLPLTAQTESDKWVVFAGFPTAPKTKPGSWGGHAVIAVGYDAWGLFVVSWGALYHVNWWFVHAYCDEAYALMSKDQLNKLGMAPNGIDAAQVSAYFEELRAMA